MNRSRLANRCSRQNRPSQSVHHSQRESHPCIQTAEYKCGHCRTPRQAAPKRHSGKKRALAHINAPAHNKPKSSIIRLEIETSIELLPSTMAFRMPKQQLHHCRRPLKYKTWSTLLIVRHDFRAIGNVVINPFCILNFQTHTPGR